MLSVCVCVCALCLVPDSICGTVMYCNVVAVMLMFVLHITTWPLASVLLDLNV